MPDIRNDFIDKLNKLQGTSLDGKELKVTGFYGSSLAYFFSLIGEKLGSGIQNPFVFLFPRPEEAEEFYNDLVAFCGPRDAKNIFFFPDWEILPFEDIPVHPDIVSQRISALSGILETNKPYFLVTSVPAIFSKNHIF